MHAIFFSIMPCYHNVTAWKAGLKISDGVFISPWGIWQYSSSLETFACPRMHWVLYPLYSSKLTFCLNHSSLILACIQFALTLFLNKSFKPPQTHPTRTFLFILYDIYGMVGILIQPMKNLTFKVRWPHIPSSITKTLKNEMSY